MHQSELLSHSTDFLSRIHNLKKDDVLTLREVVREHNKLYYQSETPIISDTEYDELFHALARLESDYDMFDESSPTARLAVLASEQFQKVKHIYPMISLDNTYNVEEVREWNERMLRILLKTDSEQNPLGSPLDRGVGTEFTYYIQPKYDGLGLALIYRFGKLEQAVTRGSGTEGEDVTLTSFEIENIPKEISLLQNTERMEIRGEVMMSRTAFDHVNRERLEVGEKLFANPRNAASGSLRQLDPLVTRSRHLQFFAYAVPQIEQEGDSQIKTYSSLMSLIASWGFERKDFPFMRVKGIDVLCKLIDRETHWYLGKSEKTPRSSTTPLDRGATKNYFDFDIDGMVLKLDDMTLWDSLGRTEHHPRYSIAYKFPSKQVRTRVLSVEHSVGRTGTVTPVANLEAALVGGVVVRRATLHNYDELAKKGVREGDFVFIMRAGEVIPEIVSVISDARTGNEKIILPPTICPVCATNLLQDEGKIAIYCPNIHCRAKIQGQLEMFVGKQGMNIDGLGTKQIELFLQKGWITDFASVFELSKYGDELIELEGYKEKSASNLFEAIEKARHTTLPQILTAIGIPNVGKKTAKMLASVIARNEAIQTSDTIEYRFLDFATTSLEMMKQQKLLSSIFSIYEEELLEVKDIGPETARAFVEYMKENTDMIVKLFDKLDIKDIEQTPLPPLTEGLQSKSFCVTGSFENISREEIHDMIEKNGGEVRTAVTGKLDYLVVGENAGSKKSKAEGLGLKIISIEEFMNLIQN